MRSLWISQLWILAAVFYDGDGQLTVIGGASPGGVFVTAFIQQGGNEILPTAEIILTANMVPANVIISIRQSDLKMEMTVQKGQTVTVPINPSTEFKGTTQIPNTVKIEADADITVISRNTINGNGDVSVVYPSDYLGNNYYIITPPNGPKNQYTEFSVICLEIETTIIIDLMGAVTVNGIMYSKGERMTLNLMPGEAFQIQSDESLSGSRVEANQNIAVIAGQTCASIVDCNLVYEQLLPVTRWGTCFDIPGNVIRSNNEIVYVMAAQRTSITYKSGQVQVTMEVDAGELAQIKPTESTPLSIQSTHGIQVLYYGCSGIFENVPGKPPASG
ncbi:hypothetical protein GDO81_014649 [Engystomops pustulosus]|uniref:IgGFc-binding protein N-terminal domain-containing protein n=1 Tax=Engystomops pustulosus TaxID=76066 RepID=A0AAV7BBX6_ENGPU|nr:hypothetical protein GDO81_014649 [Engystomops pustulosus]KAG8570021.1 hypothetical protein GDO81_014649 [Engystomops pustulosus]